MVPWVPEPQNLNERKLAPVPRVKKWKSLGRSLENLRHFWKKSQKSLKNLRDFKNPKLSSTILGVICPSTLGAAEPEPNVHLPSFFAQFSLLPMNGTHYPFPFSIEKIISSSSFSYFVDISFLQLHSKKTPSSIANPQVDYFSKTSHLTSEI